MGQFPALLCLHLAHRHVAPRPGAFLKGRITGHSSANGAITVDGPLRQPRLLTVAGNIDQFTAEVENIRLHNDGPLRFSVSQHLLQLDRFRLAGDTSQLAASGKVALNGTKSLNLQADGHVDLKLLEAYDPFTLVAGAYIPAMSDVVYMTIDGQENNLYLASREKKMLMSINLVTRKITAETDVGGSPAWLTLMGER